MLAAGEQGRTLNAATGATSLITDTSAIPLIKKLSPPEARTGAPSTPDGGGDDAAFWDALSKQVQKDVHHLPRKTGPGLDGSRFEHWMPMGAEGEDLVAQAVILWCRGAAPHEVYEACRLGRLLTPEKAAGGVRPLVITAAFRRIALKSLAKMAAQKARDAAGKAQYAVGVKGGMEKLFFGIRAEYEAKSGRCVVALDLKNAFGTMSRGTMYEDMVRTFPSLAPLLAKLYHGDTPWFGRTALPPRTSLPRRRA